MQQDEITQTIVSYVQQHQRPELALLPSHITQGMLDILIEDTKHMAGQAIEKKPNAGRYITLAVLLLKSKLKDSSRVDVTESELKKEISAYTQAIYLENLQRQGIIKNLEPEINQENLFSPKIGLSYDLTELGKRLTLDSLNELPNYSE